MTLNFKTDSPEQTESVGNTLAKQLEDRGVSHAFIALRGEMGVGKTAFVRGFASHFGIKGVKSPTYTLLNEYGGKIPIHHFDLYRIKDGDDLYSIGFDDVVESGGFCLAEWSENIEELLPNDFITVTISRLSFGEVGEDETNHRRIEINIPDGI
jgi:tRNA threonylcarbamoyladenosine biosynthesis protein TsaE